MDHEYFDAMAFCKNATCSFAYKFFLVFVSVAVLDVSWQLWLWKEYLYSEQINWEIQTGRNNTLSVVPNIFVCSEKDIKKLSVNLIGLWYF